MPMAPTTPLRLHRALGASPVHADWHDSDGGAVRTHVNGMIAHEDSMHEAECKAHDPAERIAPLCDASPHQPTPTTPNSPAAHANVEAWHHPTSSYTAVLHCAQAQHPHHQPPPRGSHRRDAVPTAANTNTNASTGTSHTGTRTSTSDTSTSTGTRATY